MVKLGWVCVLARRSIGAGMDGARVGLVDTHNYRSYLKMVSHREAEAEWVFGWEFSRTVCSGVGFALRTIFLP